MMMIRVLGLTRCTPMQRVFCVISLEWLSLRKLFDMNGEATRFKKGDKAAEKWTEEEARNALEEAFLNAFKDKDVLCVQDAFFSIDMRPSTAHYLINKFPILKDIKKDINDIVICRVNKGAINNDMNPTASIWRMKQLGEKDQQYQDHTTKGEAINKQLTVEEARALNKKLMDDI